MLRAKFIYIKEKQAFSKEDGILKLMGKPIDIAKQWKKEGNELLHVIDLDALKGMKTNFDIYDKLTYLMHVEIECGENEEFIEQLLKINARVVIHLPTKIDLKKFSKKKRLLVGKIFVDYEGDVDPVNDLIIENADLESVTKYSKMKKRVLVYKKDFSKEMEKMKELIFAVIE